MKNLEVSGFGVSELTSNEKIKFQGGIDPVSGTLTVIGLAIAIYDAITDMHEGFNETYKKPNNK